MRAVSEILNSLGKEYIVGLDVGGGMGQFASAVTNLVNGCHIIVVDNSSLVGPSFVKNTKCSLIKSDWFTYESQKKYDFVIFKTVLHHFVRNSERQTRNAQIFGLIKAAGMLKDDGVLIMQENFYESVFPSMDLSGWLIYQITKIKFIEKVTRKLGANTAGEGVRFRNMKAWLNIIERAGFNVDSVVTKHWDWELWQKIPLLGHSRYQAVLRLSKRG